MKRGEIVIQRIIISFLLAVITIQLPIWDMTVVQTIIAIMTIFICWISVLTWMEDKIKRKSSRTANT